LICQPKKLKNQYDGLQKQWFIENKSKMFNMAVQEIAATF